MPELPEVETVKRDLIPCLLGQRIDAVRIVDARVIRGITPKKFVQQLKGKTFQDISRRGKAIVCQFDDGQHLIVQLMMTGQLVIDLSSAKPSVRFLTPVSNGRKSDMTKEKVNKETKVIFELSNGTYLNYNDQRLFGRLSLIAKLEDFKHFAILGPEPFDASFNPQFIKDSLKRRSVAVKSALMDHTFVAGIGNIYASEILFRSRIDPRRKANRIKSVEIESMHRMTLEVLDEAIRFRGSSMRNYRDGQGQKGGFSQRIKVYAREDEPCVNCGKSIIKIVQSGRSTFFCKNCQH